MVIPTKDNTSGHRDDKEITNTTMPMYGCCNYWKLFRQHLWARKFYQRTITKADNVCWVLVVSRTPIITETGDIDRTGTGQGEGEVGGVSDLIWPQNNQDKKHKTSPAQLSCEVRWHDEVRDVGTPRWGSLCHRCITTKHVIHCKRSYDQITQHKFA